MMNFEQVLELIKTVSDSKLTGFQYEEDGVRIAMSTDDRKTEGMYGKAADASPDVIAWRKSEAPGAAEHDVTVRPEETVQTDRTKAAGKIVKSPLVGMFYAAASEGAAPFVQVGDTVKKGQVLAIVEAMKLMNDIESEFDGTVTEILAVNGAAVEYGQPLFCIS